jgi:hypothetical protein
MSSNESKQPHIPLEDWQRKQLLSHIEEAGGLDKANLKAICDSNPTIFGGSGKGIRRSYQNEVSNIRKRSPRNYLQLLSSYGIKPSAEAIAKAEFGLSSFSLFAYLFVWVPTAHKIALCYHSAPLQKAAAIPRPWSTAATKKKKRWALFLPINRRGRMGRR